MTRHNAKSKDVILDLRSLKKIKKQDRVYSGICLGNRCGKPACSVIYRNNKRKVKMMANFEPIPAKKLKTKGFQHPHAPELAKRINGFLENLDGEVVAVQLANVRIAEKAESLAALVLYTETEFPNEM